MIAALVQQEIYTSVKRATQMQEIEEIRHALKDRVLTTVAEKTGVNRVTLSLIRSGKKTTASRSTVIALQSYLGLKNDE